jgi:hypothetical protein
VVEFFSLNTVSTAVARRGSHRLALSIFGALLAIAWLDATAFARVGDRHVHVGDDGLKTLIVRGIEGSATFRSILAQLDAAPIQVFAECDSFMADGLSGRLNFVSTVRGVRYVQVAIRCTLSSRRQLAFLAHEFQHALEIATNLEIADDDSMENYYAGAGFQTHVDGISRTFETDRAIAIQRRVDHEMSERPSSADDAKTGGPTE